MMFAMQFAPKVVLFKVSLRKTFLPCGKFHRGRVSYRRFGQVDAVFGGKLSSWPELDCTVPAAIVRKLMRSAWSRTRINPLEPAH